MSKRRRVQIDMTLYESRLMENIKKSLREPTNAAAVKRSLMFMDWFLRFRDRGGELQINEDGKIKQVEVVL